MNPFVLIRTCQSNISDRQSPRETFYRPLPSKGIVTTILMALVVGLVPGVRAQQSGVGGPRDVAVMTRNLYVGASFTPIITATNALLVPLFVANAYAHILATDFPSRAEALADEIVAQGPDLVGLQEVSLIRIQSPGDVIVGNPVAATEVAFDYLQILLDALAARGAHYAAVVAVTNLDIELFASASIPDLMMGRGTDIRLTDRDVILARTDLPPGYLRLSNPQAGNFTHNVAVTVGGFGVTVYRGWVSVDAFVRGQEFRFINTHLDDASPLIRQLQAAELIVGPADTSLPVICVGDFNSNANGVPADAYSLLTAAGFTDAWTVTGDPGNTCCQNELLQNGDSAVSQRLDLILYRGGAFTAGDVDILGEHPADRIPIPVLNPAYYLWPSDHAGVVATFSIGKSH